MYNKIIVTFFNKLHSYLGLVLLLVFVGSLAACGPQRLIINPPADNLIEVVFVEEQAADASDDTRNTIPDLQVFFPVEARPNSTFALPSEPTEALNPTPTETATLMPTATTTSMSTATATDDPTQTSTATPTSWPTETATLAPTPTATEIPLAEQDLKVVLYLVDGMGRSDFERANTPHINKIREEGVDFINAYSLRNSRSIAGRMGILYSKTANDLPFQGNPGIISLDLKSPTLSSVLRDHEKTSGWIFNKLKFRKIIFDINEHLIVPLSHTFYGDFNDSDVADEVIRLISQEGLPSFLLVDLGDTDKNLHVFGCEAPEHRAGIEVADQQIGRIEAELKKIEGQRIIRIVSADHGCHKGIIPSGVHGDASLDDMEIPLIFAGPGIRRGQTLYDEACLFDIAPTIINAFDGIETPDVWRGLSLPIYPEMSLDHFPDGGRCTPPDK